MVIVADMTLNEIIDNNNTLNIIIKEFLNFFVSGTSHISFLILKLTGSM